ncbi:MAG: group I truncated hemoglobin, partial [Trebonia sp.]
MIRSAHTNRKGKLTATEGPSMSVAANLNIYDAIGGESALTTVVDALYTKIFADPQLARFFAGANMSRLKGRQVEFFSAALGGPHIYSGQPMRAAHAGRGISRPDFEKVAGHLTSALTESGVPDALVAEIMGAIAPLADDIVSGGLTVLPTGLPDGFPAGFAAGFASGQEDGCGNGA